MRDSMGSHLDGDEADALYPVPHGRALDPAAGQLQARRVHPRLHGRRRPQRLSGAIGMLRSALSRVRRQPSIAHSAAHGTNRAERKYFLYAQVSIEYLLVGFVCQTDAFGALVRTSFLKLSLCHEELSRRLPLHGSCSVHCVELLHARCSQPSCRARCQVLAVVVRSQIKCTLALKKQSTDGGQSDASLPEGILFSNKANAASPKACVWQSLNWCMEASCQMEKVAHHSPAPSAHFNTTVLVSGDMLLSLEASQLR